MKQINIFGGVALLFMLAAPAYATSYISDIVNDSSVAIHVSCARGSGVTVDAHSKHHVFWRNCPTGGAPDILNGQYTAASLITNHSTGDVLGYVVDSGNKSNNDKNVGYIYYTINGIQKAVSQSYINNGWLLIHVKSSAPDATSLSVQSP